MNIFQALVIILLSSNLYAFSGDDDLKVRKEGNEVIIVNFKDGDKIKLFELETGYHILTKRRGRIDLSQLPNGKYKIVDNHGKYAEIEKTDLDIVTNDEPLGSDFVVEEDAPLYNGDEDEVDTAEELELYYYMLEFNPLEIEQEGNMVTILDFEAGDIIKVFEFQSKNHVITKYEHFLDLTSLPEGRYLLENNHNQIAVVERIEIIEEDQEQSDVLIADF